MDPSNQDPSNQDPPIRTPSIRIPSNQDPSKQDNSNQDPSNQNPSNQDLLEKEHFNKLPQMLLFLTVKIIFLTPKNLRTSHTLTTEVPLPSPAATHLVPELVQKVQLFRSLPLVLGEGIVSNTMTTNLCSDG